ncbi:hypothetical protein [Chroococcidiopsis cubana]|uniref:hypothetical protein n=1 Tax=Chroococcidiopsis cubana TaxID=171392 RepID=UPI002ACD5307|nr:hypothetical protein [Chroococcidiopsis cubana]
MAWWEALLSSVLEALKQAAFNRLSVAATLKEEEIGRWFEDQQRDFLLVTQHPELQRNIKILLSGKITDPNYLAADKILSNYLISVTQTKPALREIFILDRSNQIVLSTDKQRKGNYEILANVSYFERVELKRYFRSDFLRFTRHW